MLFKVSRSVFPLKVHCFAEQTSEYRLSGTMLHRFKAWIIFYYFFSKLKKYIYIFDLFLNSLKVSLLLTLPRIHWHSESKSARGSCEASSFPCAVSQKTPACCAQARPSSTSRLLLLTLPLISSFNFLQLGKTMERCIKGPHEGPECSRQQKQKLLTHTHTHFPVQ